MDSIPGQKDPLDEGMATHSSILARKIPWTEESGGLQFMRFQRVIQDCGNLAQHIIIQYNVYLILSQNETLSEI